MSTKEDMEKPFPHDRQEGGDHYKMPIQPWDFITKNKLSYFQGNIIKYAVRYEKKNGIEDLNKIVHYCELEIKRLRESWDKFYD